MSDEEDIDEPVSNEDYSGLFLFSFSVFTSFHELIFHLIF